MILPWLLLTLSTTAVQLQFPNNIVCFPNRDFCTFQGFVEYTGKEIRIEVTRNDVIVGAAVGIPSGDPATAFEINHPGGLCWGDGTDVKITPDLQTGDKVSASFGDLNLGDIIIKDITIDTKPDGLTPVSSVDPTDNVWTIDFFYSVNENAVNVGTKFVNINQLSSRLTNGDFQDTPVGKRHVISAFGVTTTNAAYTSTILADPNKPAGHYITRFKFNDAVSFKVAQNTIPDGFSVTVDDFIDANGNPLGTTIVEQGLVGGPWSNNCPPGANNYVGPTPINAAIISNQLFVASGVVPPAVRPILFYRVQHYKGEDPNYEAYRLKTLDPAAFPFTVSEGDQINIRGVLANGEISKPFIFFYSAITNEALFSLQPDISLAFKPRKEVVTIDFRVPQPNTFLFYKFTGANAIPEDFINPNTLALLPGVQMYGHPFDFVPGSSIAAIAINTVGKTSLISVLQPGPNRVNVPACTPIQGGIKITYNPPTQNAEFPFPPVSYQIQETKNQIPPTTVPVPTTTVTFPNLADKAYEFAISGKSKYGDLGPSVTVTGCNIGIDKITITSATYKTGVSFEIVAQSTINFDIANVNSVTFAVYEFLNAAWSLVQLGAPAAANNDITKVMTCTPSSGSIGVVCSITITITGASIPANAPAQISLVSNLGGSSAGQTVSVVP